MKKMFYLITVATFTIASCIDLEAEAKELCDCIKAYNKSMDKDKLKECEKMEEELLEKYNDNEDGMKKVVKILRNCE